MISLGAYGLILLTANRLRLIMVKDDTRRIVDFEMQQGDFVYRNK